MSTATLPSARARTDDPTLASLAALDDASRWVIVPGVPALKPHTRYRYKDAAGKPLDKPLALYEVNEADLPAIAAECARLEREDGVVAKLLEDHTRLDPQTGKPLPEKDQPRIYGYARNPRVGAWGPKGKQAVLWDFYYDRRTWTDASRRPFRSVEFYPDRGTVTGIALLTKDPELDMGMLIFDRQPAGPCYFYERQETPMPEEHDQQHPAAAMTEEEAHKLAGGPEEYAKCEKLHQHFMEKHHGHLMTQHGGMGAPAGAAPAMPGATNVGGPVPPPLHHDETSRMQREQTATQYSRLEGRLQQLESSYQTQLQQLTGQLQAEQLARHTAQCEQKVMQLEDEGYPVKDRGKFVTQLAKLPAAGVEEKLSEYRELYEGARRPAPIGGRSIIPLSDVNPRPGALDNPAATMGRGAPGDGQPRTEADWDRVYQYQREHPDLSPEECVKKAMTA